MSRPSGSSRNLGGGGRDRGERKFEDVYRIYHEVEDVGKTVKASKRRARWTFSFGDEGEEQEVVLIHSVVSGKKTISYNRREIHHNEELSRAFSYTWYDGDHMLRVDIIDIVEVGTSMAKRSSDKMYELTLDGVPFNILPLKPMYPASRNKPASSHHREGSFGGSKPSHREPSLRSSFEDGDDFDPRDFNPRGSTTASVPPALKHKPAPTPAVDLLGVDDDLGAGARGGGGGTFDPFGNSDPFAAAPSGGEFGDFNKGPSASFDAFAPPPRQGSVMTASDLAKELSFNLPATRPTAGGPSGGSSSTAFGGPQQAAPAFGGADGGSFSSPTETALTPTKEAPADVDKVTASLVNLNNLLEDKPAVTVNVYKPVYTDNRSLDEMKASAPKVASQPAKPIFIERPAPQFPPPGPPRPGFGAPPFQGGFGGAPRPQMGFGGPPPPGMGGFGGSPQPPLGGFGGLNGPIVPGPMGGGPVGGGGFGPPRPAPSMMGGFPQAAPNAFGAPPPPRPNFMPPQPPPSNDPFHGLGTF